MKQLLLLGALVAVTFAGCVDNGSDDLSTDLAYQIPDVPAVDAAAVLDDLFAFSKEFSQRADNLPAHLGARDHMAEHLEGVGLDVWRQNFTKGIEQENIVGIQWGQVRDQWVVIGGHYDMTTTDCAAGAVTGNVPGAPRCATRAYSEGAYDDGSGTMMTMKLAEAYANVTPYYTIAFVAFDGEERGLQGSGAFVEAILSGDHPFMHEGRTMDISFRGMIDLDMIGLNWPGVDAPIYFDENSPELAEEMARLAEEIGMPADMIRYQGITLGRSDYAHFFDNGVPAGFMISDFEEWQLPADLPVTMPCDDTIPRCTAYPFWHLEDTYETMELMAGSAEDLQAGFQTALDLSTGLLHFLAMRPDVVLTVVE